jgi:hypothetical protein
VTSYALPGLWINLLSTGEGIFAATERGSRTQKWTNGVESRLYANGRNRAISTAGERGELGYKLVLLTQDTKDKLRTWKGLTVQVRDYRGQKWFGVFADVEVTEYAPSGLYAATITILTVDVTEGV